MDEEDTNDKCPNNQTPDTLSETGADVTDYFSSRREQMASALSSTAPKHVCVHACIHACIHTYPHVTRPTGV